MRNISFKSPNYIFRLLFVLLFVLNSVTIFGQVNDSTKAKIVLSDSLSNIQTENFNEEFDDYSPGLGIMVLIFFVFMFICIGIGIILTSVFLFLLFVLTGIGVISTSFIVGFYNRSLTKGFKAFVLLSTSIAGIVLGIISVLLYNGIAKNLPSGESIFIGTLSGLLGGLVLGVLLIKLTKGIYKLFYDKFKAP